MVRIKQQSLAIDDSPNNLSITFYVTSDGTPRVIITFPNHPVAFEHPMSDYTSLTANQKNNLKTMLLILRDETLSLEGFS